jgi:hypothetical protein
MAEREKTFKNAFYTLKKNASWSDISGENVILGIISIHSPVKDPMSR